MWYKLTWMYIWNQKARPSWWGHWTIANAVDAWTCPITLSNYYDECLEFSLDWLHFYTSNNATSSWPFQVDLATARDVTSATWSTNLHSTMYYGSGWNGNGTPHWNADGSQCTNSYGSTIKAWTPWSNWDLSQSAIVLWQDTTSLGAGRWRKFIKNWEMIICPGPNYNITTYNLATPYDLRTADLSSLKETSLENTWYSDYFFSDDGIHLYHVSPDAATTHLVLSTAWDVSTATVSETLNERASWIYFHEDKMYLKYRNWNVKQFTVVKEN